MSYTDLHTQLQDIVQRFGGQAALSTRGVRHAENAEELLKAGLARVESYAWVRQAILILVVVVLMAAMLYFVWGLLPRYHTLRISGGDILSNRHQLTTLLRQEADKAGLNLVVQPMSGSLAVLEAVNAKTIDVALVQGGLDVPLPNVRHVTAVLPETVHLLARGDIKTLDDLKGRSINLGSKNGGTRVVGLAMLRFSELESGVDFVETAYDAEELISLPEHKMPDAVLLVSTVPSFLAEELVRSRGYHLLEIPFPSSLALRHGWVADASILAYTYKTQPPVPPQDISSLGINLFMVAHKDTPDRAIVQLLDVLYGVNVRSALRQPLNPDLVTLSSGYPLSGGSEQFIRRADPIFSKESLDKLKSLVGLFMSGMTMVMLSLRWLTRQGGGGARLSDDIGQLLKDLSAFTQNVTTSLVENPLNAEERASLLVLCTQLRQAILQRCLKDRHTNKPLLEVALGSLHGLEMRLAG